MLLVSTGVVVMLQRLSDAGLWWIGLVVFFVMLGVNVLVGLLPVRTAILRTQADARRRLEDHG